jgi:hypothetical protein
LNGVNNFIGADIRLAHNVHLVSYCLVISILVAVPGPQQMCAVYNLQYANTNKTINKVFGT